MSHSSPATFARLAGFPALTRVLLTLAAVGVGAAAPNMAVAGGGPENVFLVVNPESPDSLTIANHYIRRRHIPPGNVLSLAWNPKAGTTDINTFRKEILLPVLAAIDKRRLAPQIDCIVYSSDYPWGIDLKPDADRFLQAARKADAEDPGKPSVPRKLPPKFTPFGSINGLTYLWQPVMAGHLAYGLMQSNAYMRGVSPTHEDAPTLGFKSTMQFGRHGELVESEGMRYMLSTVLGVRTSRGNSLQEVIDYLRRSAAADGTHPRGTIYYVKNSNIRSKLRDQAFPEAVEALRQLGVAAEIVTGQVPQGKHDVQGAMVGAEAVYWRSSGSTILPGAICEHLTSFGGVMSETTKQTPLSEFLRYGAAGASGTVAEPYGIGGVKFQPKFPAPSIHVHYARGCTLAEAFYQSVQGPYQLLIVGDPLCRPWANIPQVTTEGIQPGATVTGPLKVMPSATIGGGSKVDRFKLFVDGWQRAECGPGELLEWDTAQLADGHHEVRVVALEAGWIRSQGRQIMTIVTANHGRTIEASLATPAAVAAGTPVVIAAKSPGSTAIVVMHHSRLVGKTAGEDGRLTIDSSKLGLGVVSLQVVGLGKGGPLDYVTAEPLDVTIVAR
ncbi:MAG: hypothetical protein JXB62_12165 [Pirellulales bacterium]|nr:hypothetical protein [Pirellulales bacterium]